MIAFTQNMNIFQFNLLQKMQKKSRKTNKQVNTLIVVRESSLTFTQSIK